MSWTAQHTVVNLALFLFALAYNALVGALQRRGHDRGYTAGLVVGGVAATIAGSAVLIGIEDAITVAACFVASGIPMIVGSAVRHAQDRAEEERIYREIAEQRLGGLDAN
jgi:hypothetical protein